MRSSGMQTDQPAEQQIARLTLLAEARYLPAALAVVREAGAAVGLAAADVIGLDRAVDQVASNVIEHGFERGQRATFDLVVLRRPGQLVVAVEDAGLPFDFSDLEVGQGSTLAAPSLAAFADAIRFSSLGARGNRVEIVKRLPFTPIDAPGADPKPAAPPGPPVPATTPVTVRLMTPDDAVAVARCTYACYGYTVPDDYLYCPDHLREMLLGGLLEVCVGATADGEIVSCLTREVTRPGAPVGYLGEGMVEPRFRGHRLLEQMLTFLMRGAAAQQMLGLYAEAVTVHLFSQKSNLALGAFETGIQLADEAPTVVFKQIDAGAPAKRTATVLHYFKTGDAPPRTVHPPAHHRAMVERIYARGGLPRSVADAGGPAELGDGAQVRVEVFPVWSEAALRVTAYGRDLPGLVAFRLRELRLRRIDWISLDLPLSRSRRAPRVRAARGARLLLRGDHSRAGRRRRASPAIPPRRGGRCRLGPDRIGLRHGAVRVRRGGDARPPGPRARAEAHLGRNSESRAHRS